MQIPQVVCKKKSISSMCRRSIGNAVMQIYLRLRSHSSLSTMSTAELMTVPPLTPHNGYSACSNSGVCALQAVHLRSLLCVYSTASDHSVGNLWAAPKFFDIWQCFVLESAVMARAFLSSVVAQGMLGTFGNFAHSTKC